jgi:steroid delta-isomerase-like uncharacterized protein
MERPVSARSTANSCHHRFMNTGGSGLGRLVHRLYEEAFVRGEIDVLDQIMAADVVGHDTLPPDVGSGVEAYKRTVRLFRGAFTGIGYEIHQVLVAGQNVAARVTMTGIHTGDFLGVAASGRPVRYSGMDFFRCAEGKIVEHWANSDDLALLQQIGALPSTADWSRP